MESVLNIRIPDDFQPYGGFDDNIMSNFDHVVNHEVANAIKGKPFYASYSGWNFNGSVWWQNEMWHCEIRAYWSYRETISAKTPEELMESVCEKYGSE